MNLLGQLAKHALEHEGIQSFHDAMLETVSREVGAAGGGVLLQRCAPDPCYSGFTMGDSETFSAAMAHYTAALTDSELQHCLSSGTLRTDETFSSRRRDELNMFRYLKSVAAEDNVFRAWLGRDSVHFFGFARPRSVTFNRFANRAIHALDEAFPVIALAIKLHAQQDVVVPREVTLELRLTAAEHEAIVLLCRGLRNNEIGHILGVSANTIRNRLAVCFKKLGVTTRTEALFILTDARASGQRGSRDRVTIFKHILASERKRTGACSSVPVE